MKIMLTGYNGKLGRAVIEATGGKSEEESYCLQLLKDYENDPDPGKNESISIQDFAKRLGIRLE